MNILAIDPGKDAGWAFFCGDQYVESGACCGDPEDQEALQYMCQLIAHTAPDMLVIETQFLMPGRGTKNLVPLLERRFAWETLCRLRCCHIQHVVPSVWQRHFKIHKNKRLKSATERSKRLKAKIVKLARHKSKKEDAQENEADAILIGIYAIHLLSEGKLNKTCQEKKSKRKRHAKRKRAG